jgi:hypothetical protein
VFNTAASGYAAESRRYSNLSHSLLKTVTSYQIYSINNSVIKLLKVYWHGWYAHIIFHEFPKSDRVIWVATECSRPVIVGSGPVLLPNHTVYIQLWIQEVLQIIEVHVTRNFSPGEKEWSVDLCSAYSTEKKNTFGLSRTCSTTLCWFCVPKKIILWLFTFPVK